MTALERFEAFVFKTDGCWIWRGSRLPSGYGTFRFGVGVQRAHRVSWQLYRGGIPPGLSVLHSCDIRRCVNPAHLWLGTQLDNVRDRHEKNRCAKTCGVRNPNSKLSPVQVEEIRRRYVRGEKGLIKQLAAEFSVNRSQILRIGSGESWRP